MQIFVHLSQYLWFHFVIVTAKEPSPAAQMKPCGHINIESFMNYIITISNLPFSFSYKGCAKFTTEESAACNECEFESEWQEVEFTKLQFKKKINKGNAFLEIKFHLDPQKWVY